jgi:ERCC4-type nuclease
MPKPKKDTRCILVDTREKTPWKFRSQKRVCLKHGDYSILGGKGHIVIERKSLVDLYVTLSPARWDKFYEKMDRATDKLEWVFIFIEASIAEVYGGIKHSRLPVNYILARIRDLMALGIQVIFTGNSRRGVDFAENLLRNL